jgi:hypothetical protein
MSNIENHLNFLGHRVKDRVTGFKGVAVSIAFDLYGCVQVAVDPGIDSAGKCLDSLWFDVSRLKITDRQPVMEQPNFYFGPVAEGRKGPANKPSFSKP